MKRVGLIVGANIEYAPYVKNYVKIFKDNQIEYKIIEYKKANLEYSEKENIISFQNKSKDFENILDKLIGYYRFVKFVKNILKEEKFFYLVVFTPQICLFMKSFLKKKYRKRYVLDIRDYSKVFKIPFFLKNLINNSLLTVISSGGFKKWLPKEYNYLIDHNIIITKENLEINNLEKNKIKIINCGIIRSFNENLYLIKKLKNKKNIELEYRGTSLISDRLEEYVKINKIRNCKFYGYYKKEDENIFLKNSTFINIMQTNDFLSKYALPNRFYKAILLKKPIIATSDNYVGDLVKKYNLGVIINKELLKEDKNLEKQIKSFIFEFNLDNFSKNCESLYKKIKKEKENFEQVILKLLGE